MTTVQILEALANDGELAERVLVFLDHGMHDEWDCGLDEFEMWGPEELRIAAKSGLSFAQYIMRGTPHV